MRHVLAAALGVWLTLAGASAQTFYETVATNLTTSATTNTLAAAPALRLSANDFAWTLTVASPSNHNAVTVASYLQFTVDGTNWTPTNASWSLIGTTTGGTNGVTVSTNITVRGYSGVRIGGYIASTATNTTVTNALGTWR